jgi:putative restriction endonuclease
LLISVLDEIEKGRITENKIRITPELVATFKENWAALVDSRIFIPNFALPFYHLDGKGKRNGDNFWHSITFPVYEIGITESNSIRSFPALKASVDYARFDEELFLYILQPGKRALAEDYFTRHLFSRHKRKLHSHRRQ